MGLQELQILGYIASLFMGLTLGMIGGGGSILTVPILVYLFKFDPVLSTSYSLLIVGLTALVGGFLSYKNNEVDLKTGLVFATPSFIGVYLVRAYLVPNLPDPVFMNVSKPVFVMGIFAILMVAASLSMIRSKGTSAAKVQFADSTKWAIVALEGLVVGGVTGLVGAGGGFLIIPALVVLVGLPMKIAVGTSLFIIAVKSLLGFTGDLQSGVSIQWNVVLIIILAALIGLFVGKRFAKSVSDKTLKKAFGYFVLVMGLYVLIDQIY